MKKRTLSLLAALALCLTLLPGTALAEGDPEVRIGTTTLQAGMTYVAEYEADYDIHSVKVWRKSDGRWGLIIWSSMGPR